jgi:hypothetical protein
MFFLFSIMVIIHFPHCPIPLPGQLCCFHLYSFFSRFLKISLLREVLPPPAACSNCLLSLQQTSIGCYMQTWTGSARNPSPHAALTCRSTCVSSASSSPSNHSRYFFLYIRLTYLTLSGSLSLFAEHFIGSRTFSPTGNFPPSTSL